jgi:formylglycine-generating enzyme required for sulfatase activity
LCGKVPEQFVEVACLHHLVALRAAVVGGVPAGGPGRYGRLNMLRQETEYIPFSDASPGIKERYLFTDYDEEVKLDQQAWHRGNSDGKTHPVGTKAANAFGLYDMHGNVFELVEDPWHENYEGGAPTDGSVWKEDGNASLRVVRGGSWNFIPQYLRAAHRDRISRDFRYNYVGFRLARTLNP